MNLDRRQVVLKVGAAGGSITLFGTLTAEGWRYSRHISDMTPALLSEKPTAYDSVVADNWQAAIALLDRYRWHKRFPLAVHPDFSLAVLDAARLRLRIDGQANVDQLSNWQRACNIECNTS